MSERTPISELRSPLSRTIHPETRVLDEKRGLVRYIASDETLDSYGEIIRASGWRFTNFKKNAPFLDSHSYYSIAQQLGKVVDFRVENGQLIEDVQWAIDVEENELARLGWKMTVAGYLKAVSVGFWPTKWASKWDSDPTAYVHQLEELGMDNLAPEAKPRCIYIQQEQVELSACIIGANPNALAKARAAGVITDREFELAGKPISSPDNKGEHIPSAKEPAADRTKQRARLAILMGMNRINHH